MQAQHAATLLDQEQARIRVAYGIGPGDSCDVDTGAITRSPPP
jgi:hypothetical protein